jgi:hypothetical protein
MGLKTYRRPDPDHPCQLCGSASEVVLQTMTAWGSQGETPTSHVRKCTNATCDGRKGEPLK